MDLNNFLILIMHRYTLCRFLSIKLGKEKKEETCSLPDSRGIDNLVFVPDVKASSSSNPTINENGTFLKTPECKTIAANSIFRVEISHKLIRLISFEIGTPKVIRMTKEPKLRQFLLTSKMPLEKSFSVPDMQTRYKNKQRLIA